MGANYYKSWRKHGTANIAEEINGTGVWELSMATPSLDSRVYCQAVIYRGKGAADPVGTVGYLGVLAWHDNADGDTPTKIPGTDFALPSMAATAQALIPVRFCPQGRIVVVVTTYIAPIAAEVIQ